MYINVLIRKLLHVSSLTDPSSGIAQLYKTMVQPFCFLQYVELSQVHQCKIIQMDMCTVIGAACMFECVRSTHSFRQKHYSVTRCVIGNTNSTLQTRMKKKKKKNHQIK